MDHFGLDPSDDPVCRIKLGAERGLVMALRTARKDCPGAWSALHNESLDVAKRAAGQAFRHAGHLQAAGHLGYERELMDGRRLICEK